MMASFCNKHIYFIDYRDVFSIVLLCNRLNIAGNKASWVLNFLNKYKFLKGVTFAEFIL